MEEYFIIKLENGSSLEVRSPAELHLKPHDRCVFRKDHYTDLGLVCRKIESLTPLPNNAEAPIVLHTASAEDLAAAEANIPRAQNAMITARCLVEQLKLEMKLLNAHYSLDSKLVVIQFSADGRVDFRELVKELSHALCTRIELRQIGVRDETAIYGGVGVCGQPLCCARFLKEFNSINVKMAKEQDLSLTPGTISGACGRLKCCLKFEYEGYLELEKGMPRKGEWCETPQGKGRISDRNLLIRKVTVQLESGNTATFHADEISVLRPPKKNNNCNVNGKNGK